MTCRIRGDGLPSFSWGIDRRDGWFSWSYCRPVCSSQEPSQSLQFFPWFCNFEGRTHYSLQSISRLLGLSKSMYICHIGSQARTLARLTHKYCSRLQYHASSFHSSRYSGHSSQHQKLWKDVSNSSVSSLLRFWHYFCYGATVQQPNFWISGCCPRKENCFQRKRNLSSWCAGSTRNHLKGKCWQRTEGWTNLCLSFVRLLPYVVPMFLTLSDLQFFWGHSKFSSAMSSFLWQGFSSRSPWCLPFCGVGFLAWTRCHWTALSPSFVFAWKFAISRP